MEFQLRCCACGRIEGEPRGGFRDIPGRERDDPTLRVEGYVTTVLFLKCGPLHVCGECFMDGARDFRGKVEEAVSKLQTARVDLSAKAVEIADSIARLGA